MATRAISRLSPQTSALFVCDLQEKFQKTIKYFPEIVETSKRLVDTARILGMRTVVTEQYSKGLGRTVKELGIDSETPKFDKTRVRQKLIYLDNIINLCLIPLIYFSMCLPSVEPLLVDVKNVILVGIEAHVCVLQTTYDLLNKGINVHVVVDAVSSRSITDRKFAFKQMEKAGAVLTTSECVILGLLQDSAHPNFKEVQKLIMTSAPDTGLARDAKI
uniref:Isochorismatase domain-containing protein 1 n=1 Tax=Heterorhabditis bacteriophora TaxID=37862 RepID=A0A1I7WWX7_HETBA